uniref:Uncharacterized protein n=1 Tax=Arion vulgaris TaxID=1028688 RepID=A0A0B6Y882_9EUPU
MFLCVSIFINDRYSKYEFCFVLLCIPPFEHGVTAHGIEHTTEDRNLLGLTKISRDTTTKYERRRKAQNIFMGTV